MWREPLTQLTAGFMLVDPAAKLGEIADELDEAGWFVARCNCELATDKATLINAIAQGLNFPDWTGRNWDALFDAATSLDWITEKSVAVVLRDLAPFRAAQPAIWQTAREVLVEAAEWWHAHDKTLVVLAT